MTVAEAQERVTASEFAEWQAFYRLDPFGEERADYRMAILAALTTNLWLEKGDKPTRPEDFLPRFGQVDAEPELAPPPPKKPAPHENAEFRTAMLNLGKVNRGNTSPP